MFNISISIIIFSFTCISFIQIKQCKQLIALANNQINATTFDKFAFFYTKTLVNILAFKSVISQMVLGFIIPETPISIHTIIQITQKKFDFFATCILLTILSIEYFIIFGFHILAAIYSQQIHSVSRYLLKLYSTKLCTTSFDGNIRFQFKVALYIEKIHTFKRYGVHYGGCGLISIVSFGHVSSGQF